MCVWGGRGVGIGVVRARIASCRSTLNYKKKCKICFFGNDIEVEGAI